MLCTKIPNNGHHWFLILWLLGEMRLSGWIFLAISWALASLEGAASHQDQPLSRIAINRAVIALEDRAFVKASPSVLRLRGQNTEWVTLEYSIPNPSIGDWVSVFSLANFSASTCLPENPRTGPPFLCTAPIKYQYANYTNPKYKDNGKGMLKLQLIKQRSDFSFVLFSGGLSNPKLVAVSNTITFANPNSPVYPRLAQGKMWNEMTVTWTSGYGINEAEPFVEWGPQGGEQKQSPAGTLTFDRNSMCDAPARTVGWRDPEFIHTSFLKDLWPNSVYTYRLGHRLFNGTYIWSPHYQFRASPYLGQNSSQRVVIFGDMGKLLLVIGMWTRWGPPLKMHSMSTWAGFVYIIICADELQVGYWNHGNLLVCKLDLIEDTGIFDN